MVILEVVAHVLLAQPLAELRGRGVVVEIEVGVVVDQVTDHEAREQRVGGGRPEDHRECPKEQRGEPECSPRVA